MWKKIIIGGIVIVVVWHLLKRNTSSIGVEAPTSFPTRLYSPSLIV